MEENGQKKQLKKNDRVLGKPAFWDVGMNTNGNPFAKVKFSNGLTFIGYLTESAIERTAKYLAMLGFRGENPFDLKKDDALDPSIEVECTVGIDTITDKDGQTRAVPHVAFINEKFKKSDLQADQIQQLKSIDMRGYLAGHVKERSSKPEPTPTPTSGRTQQGSSFPSAEGGNSSFQSDSQFTADDIPF